MCTVTIVPSDGATGTPARMACNRDEQRTRVPALAPMIRRYGDRHALLPIDPPSDGTWVAVNDAGLAFTLLNVNLPLEEQRRSVGNRLPRGGIIQRILHCGSLAEAVDQAERIAPGAFAPFRLVITDGSTVVEGRSDGVRLTLRRQSLERPAFFTSSGLGDHLVEGPRRFLFESFFSGDGNHFASQAEFHQHNWPDRRELSVCMSRADARTVSHTVIDLGLDAVALTYFPDAPDRPTQPVSLRLERTHPLALSAW
jgi:hypothetical protein